MGRLLHEFVECGKSVTRRTLFLSALGTKNAGLHHVVGSSTGVIT